jgi:hypothetical protein
VSTARASARTRLGDVGAAIGLAAAVPAFMATFRGPRDRFWNRMTATGLGLGALAIVANPSLRRTRIGRRDVALGLGSAAVLYGTFKLGDRFARRYVPGGDQQIRQIYGLRELRPRQETALRLVAVIGPAEELFWRGLVQEALMRRYGRWRGAALAAVGLLVGPRDHGQLHPDGRGRRGRSALVRSIRRRSPDGRAHRQPLGLGCLGLPVAAHRRNPAAAGPRLTVRGGAEHRSERT